MAAPTVAEALTGPGTDTGMGTDSSMDAGTDTATGTDTAMGTDTAAAGTIVELAAGNPDLSILVEAVQAAGLAETLGGTGPFTVLAPTNAAFESALRDGTVVG